MKKILSTLLLVALGAFLWWAFSPLLFDTEVQDTLDPELEALLQQEAESLPVNPNPSEDVPEEPVLESPEDSVADTSTPIELPRAVVDGPFAVTGTTAHPASGDVRIIYSPEETLIQYQNYDGTNGPDLFVYLAKDIEANEFINLGRTKGNKGDIIYGVPLDVDLDDYKYIMTWCKTFGVLFDYVELD